MLFISDDKGTVRLTLGASNDAETLLIYSPKSTVVCINRHTPSKLGSAMKVKRHLIQLRRWKVFSNNIQSVVKVAEQLQEGIETELKLHLGNHQFATMNSDYQILQFRDFFRDENGDVRASLRGIHLTLDELSELHAHLDEFNDKIQGFKDIQLCINNPDHQPKKCRECNPK